ncbi:MAG: YhbY family RNA-binding protein [Candidatus Cloacimonetes bacterium]|nr:YhbY family RNA-binding protein [Candidatus Cloacimonadota bacterium]MCF7815378.1 YhbY family RNA-binding protein [Candidatus Cloacimonadota bacterium]MCF7869467.1 YhbY family RNA-binding protein [Candidatus Cloacimonadota bacterium]MCF7884834.1 YhbY family RNA-binding protein [Candidatus Cloacimonadota bacterium]
MNLTGKQKAKLKSIGQTQKVMVQIGDKGVTENVIRSLDEALEAHELIKISVQHPHRDIRKEMIAELAEKSESQIVNIIGKTALLFKENPEKPVISEKL